MGEGAAPAWVKVVVAGAGMAAALPDTIASHTTLPVIGVPLASGHLNGVDSLLAIVQIIGWSRPEVAEKYQRLRRRSQQCTAGHGIG